jgi:hypothetical protein
MPETSKSSFEKRYLSRVTEGGTRLPPPSVFTR